jgi:Neprosin
MPSFQRRPPLGIIPHDAYLRISADAKLSHFQYHPEVRVGGVAAFREMQQFIAEKNADLDVIHSFEDSSGQIFDCIPMEQQPGLRSSAHGLQKPPDLRTAGRGGRPRAGALPVARPLAAASRDRHGNPQQAPGGTIPVRRVTLEELIRFRDLRSFLRKHPMAAAQVLRMARPSAPDADGSKNHRYAVGYQQVDNIGGHGYISVYQPTVTANEIFSLAQHWYSGGAGANLQTVEVGWQVMPQKYGHANPVLFIFWTSDGYQTGGAYNLDSPGFVQVNSNVTIGGALPQVSQVDGAQVEMEIAVYFWNGAWWIYIDGLSSDNALGYYPVSLFGSGQMASGADTIEFGGETVSGYPPNGDWGQMGSGQNGSAGWEKAAYQRCIYYYTAAGGSDWASLDVVTPVSPCYTFNGGFDSTGSWGTYFFFGGAGGSDC